MPRDKIFITAYGAYQKGHKTFGKRLERYIGDFGLRSRISVDYNPRGGIDTMPALVASRSDGTELVRRTFQRLPSKLDVADFLAEIFPKDFAHREQ